MGVAEFFDVVSNMAMGVAAAITAGAALVGLASWRDQRRGRAEFEVAVNVARAMYALRDEIQNCRSPFVFAHELPKEPLARGESAAKQAEAEYRYIKGNRMQLVRDAMRELAAQTLHAEAMRGRVDHKSRPGADGDHLLAAHAARKDIPQVAVDVVMDGSRSGARRRADSAAIEQSPAVVSGGKRAR